MTIARIPRVPSSIAIGSADAAQSARSARTVRTVVGAALLLLGGETTLRVRAYYRHGHGTTVADLYEPDPTLGRRPRPGSRIQGSRRQTSINRFGFRGAEVEDPKPAGTTRITAVGDSTTFGLEAESDDSVWVARLVRRLNAKSSDRRFDAVNAAVPGYTLAMSTERLLRDVAPLEPDVVIVQHVVADVAAHGRRQFGNGRSDDSTSTKISKFLQEHSVLVNIVQQNTAPWLTRFMPHERHDRVDERGVQEYSRRLTELVRTCRGRGWPTILCTAPRSFGEPSSLDSQYLLAGTALANNPSLSLAGLNDAYDRYNNAVRAVAAVLDVPLVDLDRLLPRGGAYFVDAVHLNDAGHDHVAEHLADALRSMPRIARAVHEQSSERPQPVLHATSVPRPTPLPDARGSD